MFGTIARLQLKPGAEESLRQFTHAESTIGIPGFLFQYLYQADAGSNEYFLAVGFTNREYYVANAESPEQNERYLQFRALLVADPEWHDGEIIDSYQFSGS